MKSHYLKYILGVAAIMGALSCYGAATVDNQFFTLNISDDSWQVTATPVNKDATSAAMEISRADGSRQIIELARVECIEMAFQPAEYLRHEAINRANVFCRAATDFSEIGDTIFAGRLAQRVHFIKKAAQHDYYCTAIAFNSGYSTMLVITSHRDDVPNVVGVIVGRMALKAEPKPLKTVAQYVEAMSYVLDNHSLPINVNERLTHVDMPDSTTVELEIAVDYITQEGVNVPVFVQAMRDRWLKALPSAYKMNSFTAEIVDERLNLRHVYVDNKGYDIGTLEITPTEYMWVLEKEKKKNTQN